jgi:hypothetical protein
VLGALSIACVPAGILAARLTDRVELVTALAVASGAGIVLGIVSIVVRRVARRRSRRSVQPDDGPLRAAKWLGWLGLYLGVMGALALAFYGLLRLSE